MSFWDRIKWLVLLAVIWLLLVWSLMADNPLIGFVDALPASRLRLGWWVFVLVGLEFLHQLHFLISERSARRTTSSGCRRSGARSERLQEPASLSAWTQFRIGRVIRWVIVIAVIAIITGKIMHDAPLTALVLDPGDPVARAADRHPVRASSWFFTVAQFALLFWFLSRGGVDVYYPDDIKTRFSDVWGQDHVLERVKENIIFLENPELVEDHGGYVPGGILLWGPPGTGKTLMAEAVAGETGKPYVFVDPRRVHQHVHRRRHPQGQVPVPQAAQALAAVRRRDRLLRRGRLARQPRHRHGRRRRRRQTGARRRSPTGCHGFSYLSPTPSGC